MKYKLLTLVAFVSLVGCETSKAVPEISPEQVQAADQEAREALEMKNAPIPENLKKEQRGPVSVEQTSTMHEDTARSKWNTDRQRLRQCVATHKTLVKLIELRDLPFVEVEE